MLSHRNLVWREDEEAWGRTQVLLPRLLLLFKLLLLLLAMWDMLVLLVDELQLDNLGSERHQGDV